MNLSFELSGSQINGARDYQEDAFLITHLGESGNGEGASLVIVADGMGGHAAGNVASNMAVQTFNKYLTANYPTEEMPRILRESVMAANGSITETVRETAALKGMGCTLVAVVLEKDKMWWVSVGDSNLYLLRDKKLTKKNADHSYGGFLDKMAAAGKPVEPEEGFSRNMLMSALTGDEIAEIDCPENPLELQAGDRIVIATDGLNTLTEGKLIQFSEWSKTPKEYCETLLKAVDDEKLPRQDNTTAVVCDCTAKGGAQPAEPPPPPKEERKADEDDTQPTIPRADVEAAMAEAEAARVAEHDEEAARARKKRLTLAVGIIGVAAIGAAAGWLMLNRPARQTHPEPMTQAGGPQPATPAPTPAEKPKPALVQAPAKQTTAPAEPASAPPSAASAPGEAPAKAEEGHATAQTTAGVKPAAKPETFRDHLKSGGEGPEMVWIPAGSYEMGAPPTSIRFNERPQHEVHVPRFAMSVYEVTFDQYARFARATGHRLPAFVGRDRKTYPVVNVSWDDAVSYARWLSEQTGHHYHLPSEAEWEYAASAGTMTDYWWGQQIGHDHAECFGCNTGAPPGMPTKVGSFAPNPFGVYDTAGNVAEWVYDCYHPNYQGAPSDGSVWKGGDCSERVIRGGAYDTPPPSLRSRARDKMPSNQGYDDVGIRLARDP